MKVTTVTLYDERGEPLPPVTFPSAREAREAEAACREKILAALGWTQHSAKLAELAWFLHEKVAREFYDTHGYPYETPSLAWLEERLSVMSRQMMQLSSLNAPPVILENQRRLIAQREGWIKAWKKEHGDE
jgi:hypothetical protein